MSGRVSGGGVSLNERRVRGRGERRGKCGVGGKCGGRDSGMVSVGEGRVKG